MKTKILETIVQGCVAAALCSSAHAVVWTDWASGSLSHISGAPTNPGDEVYTDSIQCAVAHSPQSYCNDTFTISWDVDKGDNGTWRYSYGLTATTPDLSHWIIQVSDTFTERNLLGGSTGGGDLDSYGPGSSNPGMPSAMYGVKWEFGSAILPSTIIISDRIPVWGNIYLKGGSGPYAYNSGWFGAANGTAVLLGADLFGFIARPDTLGSGGDDPLPVPGIVFLVIAGMLGLVLRASAGRR